MNKKADVLGLSLTQILGICMAALIIVALFGFYDEVSAVIFPGPSAVTNYNFERLVWEINNLKDNDNPIAVPYHINLKDNIKLVTMDQDTDCYPQNCICICKTKIGDPSIGCGSWKKRECFKADKVTIHLPGMSQKAVTSTMSLLLVNKVGGVINIESSTSSLELVCCEYIKSGTEASAKPTMDKSVLSSEDCKSKIGWHQLDSSECK